jgi:MFS family permease
VTLVPGGLSTWINDTWYQFLPARIVVLVQTDTTLRTPSPPAPPSPVPGTPGPAPAPPLTRAGLLTLLLGAALAPIDLFIVNVALPTIGADLHASSATLEWVVAGYGIAFALLLVPGGRLGDAFGRRRMFRLGLAGFTLTSLVCGLAPTALVLVLARVAQGAAAALLVPQVLSVIQATTSGERRARTLGYYGSVSGIGMVIGQLAGGALVGADLGGTGWRPIFLVAVPVGLLGVLLAGRALPETRSDDPVGVDRAGTVLLGAALLALLVPLMHGGGLGRPLWCWALLAAFPVLFTLFLRVEARLERRGGAPLLPPALLAMPSMRRGLAVGVPFFGGFGGFMFVYALLLQQGLRLGPLAAGLALTPLAVSFFVATLLTSRLVARFGHRVVVAGGLVGLAGLLMLAAAVLLGGPRLGVLALLPGTLVYGLGQGLVGPTLFRVILSRVPAGRAGVGSGVLTTTQQSSLALGVAVLGSLYAALSAPTLLGPGHAAVAVTLLQCLGSVGFTVLAGGLPDPRR